MFNFNPEFILISDDFHKVLSSELKTIDFDDTVQKSDVFIFANKSAANFFKMRAVTDLGVILITDKWENHKN